MANAPYITSNELVEAVKRAAMIPVSQKTFTANDILQLANYNMDTFIVPEIMTYFSSYFLRTEDITIVPNKSKYEIPYRAIGLKLQDVIYRDSAKNLYEMARIQPDERVAFNFTGANYNRFYTFYVENNFIVLVPGTSDVASGSLEMTYYLKPNRLVTEDRVAKAQSFLFRSAITLTGVISGDQIVIDSTTYTAGIDFAIGINDTATAANLAAILTGFTTTSSSNVVNISKSGRFLTASAGNNHFSSVDTVVVTFDQLPTNLAVGSFVDFLQARPGFRTYEFDYVLPQSSADYVAKTLTLPTADLPEDFTFQDFVVSASECIIPQMPPELHNVLVQHTVCSCLEAMGDTQGLMNAKAKLDQMVINMGNLIDNRVESTPQKVFNRHSPLRLSKYRNRSLFKS